MAVSNGSGTPAGTSGNDTTATAVADPAAATPEPHLGGGRCAASSRTARLEDGDFPELLAG